jgi:LysM repeat protein
MPKKMLTLLTIVVLLSVSLSACILPASTPPPTVNATATGGLPFPVSSPNAMLTEIVSGTQPAQAGSQPAGAVTQPPAQPTAEPVVVPTATLAVVPTATPGRPSSYIVQKGESQYCLARRFNVNPADLAALNGLSANAFLDPGMTLKIPQSGSWTFGDRALKTHPVVYTVASGDSIYSIACAFGDVDPNMIILANGLKEPYTLTTGQSLQIP